MNQSGVQTGQQRSIAVIGAGIAGLSAAREVLRLGADVTVFDRSGRVGGRASSRVDRDTGEAFDHGAQYFTVRDERFEAFIDACAREGVVAPWAGEIVAVNAPGEFEPKGSNEPRYVGVPTMGSLAEALARTVGSDRLRLGASVASFRARATDEGERDSTLLLDDRGGELGAFDAVIAAVAAPQLLRLGGVPAVLRKQAERAEMQPCWATMATFAERLDLPGDGVFVNFESSELSWMARDSSKPGRIRQQEPGDRWVLHARAEWSAARLESEPESIATVMLEAMAGVLTPSGSRGLPRAVHTRAHRWSFALTSSGSPGGCLWDAASGVAAAGDWCHGGRVEGAFLSGLEAAGRVIASLGGSAES